MAGNFDSAVGAALEIPEAALTKIKEAETAIKDLAKASETAANDVKRHWGTTALEGLDKFIEKITSVQTALNGLSSKPVEFNINTNTAQQNLESLSSQTKKTTQDISATVQKLDWTKMLDLNPKDLIEHLRQIEAKFVEVDATIKGLQKSRSNMLFIGDDDQVTKLNNIIEKLKQFTAERKKSSEQIEAAERKQAEAIQRRLEAEQKALQRKADTDRNAAEQLLNNLYTQRLNILSRIEAQNTKAAAGQRDLTNAETQMAALLSSQLTKIDSEISNLAQKYPQLAQAARGAFNVNYAKAMADENLRLEQALNKTADAQQRLKDANIKSLVSEYKQLTKEAENLARSMKSYRDSGGNIANPKYQAIEQQWTAVIDRMNAIERQQITEITQFRNQQYIQSLQADLSAFVQNEEQKKARALQTIKEESDARRAAYQQYITSYEGALRAAEKLNSGRTSGNYADTFENRARVIKQLETAMRNLSKADADYERKVETLRQKLKELGASQEEVNRAMKGQTTPTFASAQQAVATARATKSLQDYKTAYEQLKAVMATMDSSSVQFKRMSKDAQEMKKNIDNINKAMGDFKGQTRQSTDLMNQLGNRIAAAFSVAAISGFIKKVVDTRAQFELQRVALGAIIQDVDEANKTFVKIQNMALE